MWLTVENREVIYPLTGNEESQCRHHWIGKAGSSWSPLGNGYVWDGLGGAPGGLPELQKSIEEYETRTGRSYYDEVQKVSEAIGKAGLK